MKGSEAKLVSYMQGSDKRFIIPVYQRNYDWRIENCKQLYDDLMAIIPYRNQMSEAIIEDITTNYIKTGKSVTLKTLWFCLRTEICIRTATMEMRSRKQSENCLKKERRYKNSGCSRWSI